jgi:hypothetical protein
MSRASRAPAPEEYLSPVIDLTAAEAWQLYDERASEELGVSADELEELLATGEVDERGFEHSALEGVLMLRVPRVVE